MDRARRQTPAPATPRAPRAAVPVCTARPLVVDLDGWRVVVRTLAAAQPAHGWTARRIPHSR